MPSPTTAQLLHQSAFMLSAPTLKHCPADDGFEIAFAGRSNAGKSSAINTLTQQRQLARASKTPGRTQMINFFSVGANDRRLVDLPGYGYASVPETMKIKWQKELESYLIWRKSLQGLILLVDIRRLLTDFDSQMLQWANNSQLSVHILLTKADKLGYGARQNALQEISRYLTMHHLPFSVQLFSSLHKMGLNDAGDVIADWLQLHAPPLLQTPQAPQI